MTKKAFKNLLLCIPIGLLMFGGINNVGAVNITTTKTCSTTAVSKSEEGLEVVFSKASRYGNFYKFKIGGKRALCLDAGKHMKSNQKYIQVEDASVTNSVLIKQAYKYASSASDEDYDEYKILAAQIVVWGYQAGLSESDIEAAIIASFKKRGYLKISINETIRNSSEIEKKAIQVWEEIKSQNTNVTLQVFKKEDGNSLFQRLVTADVELEECEVIKSCYNSVGKKVDLTEACKDKDFDKCVNENCNFCETSNGVRIDVFQKCAGKTGDEFDACYNKWCDKDTSYSCTINTVSKLPSCDNENSDDNKGYFKEATQDECIDDYLSDISKNSASGSFQGSYGSYCRLDCLDSVEMTYPTTVKMSVATSVGRYIVWPNSVNDTLKKKNANLAIYTLQIQVKKVCKMYVDTDTLINAYTPIYNTYLKLGAKAYYKDADNREISKRYSDFNGYGIVNYSGNEATDTVCETEDYVELEKKFEACKKKNKVSTWYCDVGGKGCNYSKTACEDTYGTCVEQVCNDCWNQEACSTDKTNFDNYKTNWGYDECTNYYKKYNEAKRILQDLNTCATASISTNDQVNISYKVSYDDEKYGGDYDLKAIEQSSNLSTNYKMSVAISTEPKDVKINTLSNYATSIESQNIEIGTQKIYNLADNYYYYVNNITSEAVHSKPDSNFKTIGFSNLPISYNAKSNKEYSISLKATASGTKFDEEINNLNYVCKYTPSATSTDTGCKCPSNSKYPGKDLIDIIAMANAAGEKLTCADAQSDKYDYCYDGDKEEYSCDNKPEKYLEKCTTSGNSYEYCYKKYCDNDVTEKYSCKDKPELYLEPCIKTGKSYDYCYKKYCDSSYKSYHCPAGTTNEGMNLDACVIPMIESGNSEKDAYNYCVNVTCPGGTKIIYRTISLRNPFPSYDADDKITQTGLKIGMFNDTVSGRYPGSNWKGESTVKSKILNNRSVDGDEVYNKTPLYTFVLNSQTIRAIRTYNKNNDYADFNLNCKLSNSAACVSSFVHDSSLSGLVSNVSKSTCGGTLTASNFYTCDD